MVSRQPANQVQGEDQAEKYNQQPSLAPGLDSCENGVKYCPNMCNILLPVYISAHYKPGGSGGLAEQKQMSEHSVCKTCEVGPRCSEAAQTKTGREISDGSPGANSTRTAHSSIMVTVSSVQV